MLTQLLTLVLAVQSGVAARPFSHWVAEGWACHSRPSGGAVADLQRAGCERTRVADLDPQDRELWFLAEVGVDSVVANSRAPLGVGIGAVAASELFWNEVRIGGNGVPGPSRSLEQPGRLDAVVFLPADRLHPGRNLLLVRMSGHHNRVRLSTPVHFIVVADYRSLLVTRTPYYIPAVMMAGALLVAIVYFGGDWMGRRSDRQPGLVVALAACALLQLIAEVWRGLWPLPYPWQGWRLVSIQLLATGFSLALVAYVTGRFATRWRAPALWGVLLIVAGTVSVPGYDIWTFVTLTGSIALTLGLVIPAARRGDSGARALAAALALLLALAAIDAWGFLDRGFFLGSAALALVLLRDQWRVGVAAQEGELVARRRAAQLEVELLRRRFAPHWLLNTLNSIIEWIESEPRTAVRLIEAVGEQYHLVAEMSGKPLVTLAEEVALCRTHLEVMSMRVDRAFHLECVDLDGRLELPPGVVQTLIENAFTHGRYATGATFVLRQVTGRDGIQLELTTPVPEEVVRADADAHRGEGLTYVRAQLHHAFGTAVTVIDGPTASGGWRTKVPVGRSR
jgi:hypothetical protein